jgi:hypothetical protein
MLHGLQLFEEELYEAVKKPIMLLNTMRERLTGVKGEGDPVSSDLSPQGLRAPPPLLYPCNIWS